MRLDTPAPWAPIPYPPGHLFVGNLFDLDTNHPNETPRSKLRGIRRKRRLSATQQAAGNRTLQGIESMMVGPGTGVAPFRGFLQERAALKQQGVPVGESLLFFGCRDPRQDFLYEDEMRAFAAAGVTQVYTAFSRQPGKPKTYVQQAIQEQSAAVWRLLQQEAVIFVCGDASRMAPDVRKAFASVFQERTGASQADAQAWFTGLVANHRYLEDIWASAT